MSSTDTSRPLGQGHYVKPRETPAPLAFDEASLNAMIESASHSQLSYLLQDLCSRSKTAAKLTNARLVSLQKEPEAAKPKPTAPRSILKKTRPLESSLEPGTLTAKPPASPPPSSSVALGSTADSKTTNDELAPLKRKAMSHCRNCGRDYTLAESADDTCTHHPGEREVNEDHEVWKEFDPDYLGDAWTLMEYERFASGFRWSCCKRGVTKSGCRVGIHEAAPGEWKKAKG